MEEKKMHTLSKEDFGKFIDNLIADNSLNVVGVKSKDKKFAFGPLESANQLRLDYDVTLLPPKKYFFPQRETLVTYDVASGFQARDLDISKSTIIVGVHPYDIMALIQMDEVFRDTKSDPYYLERRNSSVIIGVNIKNISKWCFAPSMGCATINYGYDLMLTDLGDRFAIDVGSHKGADLLNKYAKNVKKAYASDINAVGKKKMEIITTSENKFNFSSEIIPEMLQKFYEKDSFWEDHSETCFSCGSCVTTCPTCYCFDVKDNPDLSLKKGERTRTWDGCLLEDFAKVASGENFRDKKATRYRHRYFKKGKYLFDRFGFIACVGCGRCASSCLPDIANPVTLFNDMYAESIESGIQIDPATIPDISIKTDATIEFTPKIATIINKVPMTANETMFEIKLDDETDLGHQPGQFVQVSVFGVGEAPFGVSSSPTKKGSFELCIRKLGNVTTKIHTLNKGDKVGIRGPFGKGFDSEFLKGKDLLFIAGGLGIVPLRSLLNYVLANRKDYGRVILLYGCKEPRELLFGEEILDFEDRDDIEFKATVDWCPEDEVWTSNIGVITTLIPQIDFDPQKTYAVVCGPPIMYKFVIKDLKSRNVPDDHIIVSLERRMKCGVGKCGHCQINQLYVCKDGPVFRYSDIKGIPEAL